MKLSLRSMASKFVRPLMKKLDTPHQADKKISLDADPEKITETDLFEFEMNLEVIYTSQNKVKDIVLR